MRGRALAGFLGLGAALLALASGPLGAPTASAAVEPGTPVAVAPGVPGNGRGWELVTPPDVVSALLYNVRALSADGNRVSYMTIGPLPAAASGAPFPTTNVAVREVSGWANHPVRAPYPLLGAPPASYYSGPIYPGPLALSPDFATSIWTNYLPVRPHESDKEVGLFRQMPDGAFALLGEIGASGRFIGASQDLEHVFFTSQEHLLDVDANRVEGESIYEIVGSALRMVDVDDEGAPLSDCGSTVRADEYGAAIDGAISSDGQRIFFTTRPSCMGQTRVYLAQAGTSTEISASQCALPDCGPEADISFVGATPSGSSAFLVTKERLTDDDLNASADLYRYDVASGALALLSTTPSGVGVAVAAGDSVHVSMDGSRVYFRGTPQSGPEEGGGVRLYLGDQSGLRAIGPSDSLVQLSTDGRYALLATSDALTASDTDGRVDLYRYDAEKGTAAAVSVGGSVGGNGPFDVATAPEYFAMSASSQPYRSMSDDGKRIFFSTHERLVSGDRNDSTDIYEWTEGSLALISSGAGDRPDLYLGASPDGRTVLFRTTATLLPSDRDGGEMDFYVARIGGGFPESAPPESCRIDPCASAPREKIDRATPHSARPRRGGIQLRRLGPVARRRFVASGWITLLAEAPQLGHLLAEARAQIGKHSRTIASTDVHVARPGPVRLRMRLSREARRRLAAGDRLRVRLVLRFSRSASIRRVNFALGGAP